MGKLVRGDILAPVPVSKSGGLVISSISLKKFVCGNFLNLPIINIIWPVINMTENVLLCRGADRDGHGSPEASGSFIPVGVGIIC